MKTVGVVAAGLSAALAVALGAPVGWSATVAPRATAAPSWVHELGTTKSDGAFAIAAQSAGTTYVAGETTGKLPSAPSGPAGGADAFVAKYAVNGSRVWVRQFGSSSDDHARAVAVDSTGNVYVAGYTSGRLPSSPQTNAGLEDVFLAKYSAAGAQLWVRQLGSSDHDYAYSVATDSSGNVFVTGYTFGTLPGSPESHQGLEDTFLAKYSSAGALLWVHELGTTKLDKGKGVAVDSSGNAYISGNTDGKLPGSPTGTAGGRDVFMAKYSSTGARLWVRELGSAVFDGADGIAVDSAGNAYLNGGTWGTLPGSPETGKGQGDAFLVKYSPSGTKLWVHELGSNATDWAYGVAVDASGAAYISGYTYGKLPGSPDNAAGMDDAYVAKYAANGARVWVRQLGTSDRDASNGVAVDGNAKVYVVGVTKGALPGSLDSPAGSWDAFVAQYTQS